MTGAMPYLPCGLLQEVKAGRGLCEDCNDLEWVINIDLPLPDSSTRAFQSFLLWLSEAEIVHLTKEISITKGGAENNGFCNNVSSGQSKLIGDKNEASKVRQKSLEPILETAFVVQNKGVRRTS